MKNMNRKNPENYGDKMRQRAMNIAMKRKEEYLGARVPKALKERVIKYAEEMQIPVSLLIRKVLEERFPENSSTINDMAESKPISENKEKLEKNNKYADIVGWKAIEVNHDRSCERCKEPLPKGSEASLGFNASDSGYVIVCHQCKSQILNDLSN
ncbi:MAG: hypothetical protein R3240_01195 [Gammaproteobacteria bacterium]|nr:hypothetical protein [Gammaproteobacteria bacterium]